MFTTYVGTNRGVYRLDGGSLEPLGLDDHEIYAVHSVGETVLAGSYGEGVFRSEDGGTSWREANDGLTATALRTFQDDNIHYVSGHPENPDVLLLALGWAALRGRNVDRDELGGVGLSEDGGKTWRKVIREAYTRAVLIPPKHPNLILAGPAKAIGRQGRILVSEGKG